MKSLARYALAPWLLLLSFIFLIGVSCSMVPTRPVSDHFDGKRFFNPEYPKSHGFTDFLKMMVGYRPQKWPEQVSNQYTPETNVSLDSDQVAVTFVNHATVLIQMPGVNILTDPVWSQRASPLTWVGPKRVRPPAVDFDSLPKIDLVLLSHNHYDHMDVTTLKRLSERFSPKVLVPVGDKALLDSYGIANVSEMDWWESLVIQTGLKVTFTPAQHFSARGLFDRNKSLWGSFMIEAGSRRIYFGGDTGYASHFTEVRKRLGAPDLSFLPIGAYEPNWFMKPVHMNPSEAVQAHLDLGSKSSVGIHFGTFQLTEEAIDQPIQELNRTLDQLKLDRRSFVAPEEGRTITYRLSGEATEVSTLFPDEDLPIKSVAAP